MPFARLDEGLPKNSNSIVIHRHHSCFVSGGAQRSPITQRQCGRHTEDGKGRPLLPSYDPNFASFIRVIRRGYLMRIRGTAAQYAKDNLCSTGVTMIV